MEVRTHVFVEKAKLLISAFPDVAWDLGLIPHKALADIVFFQFGVVHHFSGTGDEVEGAFQDYSNFL